MTKAQNNQIIKFLASYYSEKLADHGISPQGVDWNGVDSQVLRFEQLCKIINISEGFSINDVGCGYGALLDYISKKFREFSYTGIDISKAMIDAANSRYKGRANTRFLTASQPDIIADFGIASGIFNVRLEHTDEEWISYIFETLNILNQSSRIGFSANFLTFYSDEDKKQDYLYYANPGEIFDHCKCKYSKNVSLLHDYDLYEFTILVKKC